MNITRNKVIRDSVHGYITVPEIIMQEIVDTPVFQRLRRIEQTSMRCLYPSARHDRFVHSLGVYHLGTKAVNGLIQNISLSEKYYKKSDASFWERHKLLFSIACLLHDCAHAPFSHSFEYIYIDKDDFDEISQLKTRLLLSMLPSNESNTQQQINESFNNFVNDTEESVRNYFADINNITPHELISSIIASEYFRDRIYSVIEHLFEIKLTVFEKIDYIQFIQRAIIGLKYKAGDINDSNYRQVSFRNCLIGLLNSKTFDVDKLDYIVRDSIESGVDNMSVDIERLLNALTIIEVHHYGNATHIEGDIENAVLFERYNVQIGETLENDSELSIELNNADIDGNLHAAVTLFDGYLKSKTGKGKIERSENQIYNDIVVGRIEKGIIKGSFLGTLEAHNYEGTINGPMHCRISGEFEGKIIGEINLNNNGRTIYEIGYKKDAISILEDTIIARNRLYLWIYAHHKVTYSDYALRQAILFSLVCRSSSMCSDRLSIMKAGKEKLSEMICIDSIINDKFTNYLIDDGNLTTIMKESISYCNENRITNEYSEEWISRKYKYSVWKSFAEFNSLFPNLSDNEFNKLWCVLFDRNSAINDEFYSQVKEGNTSEYENSALSRNNTELSMDSSFVWIKPSGIKLATMNVEATYVIINDRVQRLKDILVREKVSEQYANDNFFYLYSLKRLDTREKYILIHYLKSIARIETNSHT